MYPPRFIWCKLACSGETVRLVFFVFVFVSFFLIKEKNWLHQNVPADANMSWYLPHSIFSKWQSVSVSYCQCDRRCLFHLIINNTSKRTSDNYARRFPVKISLIRINTWNIKVFQNPAGNTASKYFPRTIVEFFSFCSDFKARDMLNFERRSVLLREWNRN